MRELARQQTPEHPLVVLVDEPHVWLPLLVVLGLEVLILVWDVLEGVLHSHLVQSGEYSSSRSLTIPRLRCTSCER